MCLSIITIIIQPYGSHAVVFSPDRITRYIQIGKTNYEFIQQLYILEDYDERFSTSYARQTSGATRWTTNTKIRPFTLQTRQVGVVFIYVHRIVCIQPGTTAHRTTSYPSPVPPRRSVISYTGVDSAHSLIHSAFANVVARLVKSVIASRKIPNSAQRYVERDH